MTTGQDVYKTQVLLALQARGVPGERIAQTIAEIESHVAETGEDPREAFGDAHAYAQAVATAVGVPGNLRRRPARWSWRGTLAGLVAAFGTALFLDGCRGLGSGRPGPSGLPPSVAASLGGFVLVALTAWSYRVARRDAVAVVDPRTGTDLVRPLPRWNLEVIIAAPVAVLVVGVVVLITA